MIKQIFNKIEFFFHLTFTDLNDGSMLVGMPGQSPSNNSSLAPNAVLSPFAQQQSGLNTSKVQSPMSVPNTVLSPYGQQSTGLNSSNISNAQQTANNQFITSNGPSNASTVLPQMTPPHSNNPMQRQQQMLQNQSQQMNQSNQQGNVNQQPPTPNAQNSQQLTPGSVPHTPNPQTNQMISTSQSQQPQQMHSKQSSTQVRIKLNLFNSSIFRFKMMKLSVKKDMLLIASSISIN